MKKLTPGFTSCCLKKAVFGSEIRLCCLQGAKSYVFLFVLDMFETTPILMMCIWTSSWLSGVSVYVNDPTADHRRQKVNERRCQVVARASRRPRVKPFSPAVESQLSLLPPSRCLQK